MKTGAQGDSHIEKLPSAHAKIRGFSTGSSRGKEAKEGWLQSLAEAIIMASQIKANDPEERGDKMDSIWSIPYGEIAWRLVLAGVLGGLVGWERERDNHPAGFRTHILVSLGSALIMLISIYGFSQFMGEKQVQFDPARLSAQVVSGIGFLGAGTILRHGFSVTGLTTAASLWVVSGIGLAVGAGFTFGALVTTVLVLISLELLNRMESMMIRKRQLYTMQILVRDEPGKLGELASLIASRGGNIRKVDIDEKVEYRETPCISIRFRIRLPQDSTITDLVGEVRRIEGIYSVETDV